MYDALLEGLDDEPLARPEDPLELAEDVVDALDEEVELDPSVLVDGDEDHEAELDVNPEELLAEIEEAESWSDDPVRMYLTQMGEIPLLTRRKK